MKKCFPEKLAILSYATIELNERYNESVFCKWRGALPCPIMLLWISGQEP